MKLAGKVAIITGAGRGMGRAGAELFASEGATVVVAERREVASAETVAAVQQAGGKAIAVSVDVTNDESVQAMVNQVLSEFGTIDVLWNNVGGLGWLPDGTRPGSINLGEGGMDVATTEPEDWEWLIRFNLTSAFLCCRRVLPAMISNRRGSIISTSSASAYARTGNFAPYAVAKGGIVVLSRLMAKKYGPLGIRSNVIVPGLIDSWDPERLAERARETVPLGRIGRLDEVARAALFLASDDSSFITGEEINLDGGSHI